MQEQADSPQPQQQDQTPQPEQEEQQQSPQQAPSQPSFEETLLQHANSLDNRGDNSDKRDTGRDTPSPTAGEDAKEETPDKAAETPKEVEKPAAAAPKPSAWASLKKREQDLIERQNSWSKEREELTAKVREVEGIKARAKEDVFEALKHLGHDDPRKFLEEIAKTGGRMTPEQKRIAELENMVKSDREERQRLQAEQQQRAEQHHLEAQTKHWHTEIGKFIRSEPELKDGLASVPGVEPAIFQVMQEHYAEHQEQMPFKDAAKIVEKNLEERVNSMLNDIVANKRGREVFEAIAAKINKPAPASKKAPQGITQSISNSTNARRSRPVRFEEALDGAANWLDSQMK